MGIVLFALAGAAIAYFGGSTFGLYEGYGAIAPFVGAGLGAVAAGLIGMALKPRREVKYNGPAFD